MTRLKQGYGSHRKNIQVTNIDGHIIAKIGLGKNLTTTISLSDIDILKEHRFYPHKRKDGKYVARSTKGAYLHRLIMDPNDDQEVDHVDVNPLNNTRGNLRRCSKRQNNLAKTPDTVVDFNGIAGNSSIGYQAFNEKGRPFGCFKTAREAAQARDDILLEKYFHSEHNEELHTYSFISWNIESPKEAADSENYLFDEIQEAQWHSFNVLNDHGWKAV